MTLFFYGPNVYALRQQLAKMVDAYQAKVGSDASVERVSGGEVKFEELYTLLSAIPFLATSRLVIVEGVVANKATSARLRDLLMNIPSSTVAVFVEREPDQRTVAFKALNEADKVVKFEPVVGPKLQTWLRAEVRRLGGEIQADAARELVDIAGEDQWRLSEELQKLVNYQPQVDVVAVRELVTPSLERSIFELVEAMAAGQAGPALGLYHDLLEQRQSEMYVLTMVQWQLRNLLLARTAPVAMSPTELAKAASLSPYVASKAMSVAGRLSESGLIAAYESAVACEYDIKTGRQRGEVAVEQLIWRVASTQLQRRPA